VSNAVLIGNITIPAKGDGAEGEGGDDGVVGNGFGGVGFGVDPTTMPTSGDLPVAPAIGPRWMARPAWVQVEAMLPPSNLADQILSTWEEGESESAELAGTESWMESLVDYLSKRTSGLRRIRN
jgi:hypothetical protein